MKISMLLDSSMAWQSGIWYHRQEMPMRALALRGHAVNQIVIRTPTMTDQEFDWPDTVIFSRTYPTGYDCIGIMKEYKKRGKRVLYDMDDDFWQVEKDNPSVKVSNAFKDQYETMIRLADACITPSVILAKKLKKLNRNVFICPNGIDYSEYPIRPGNNPKLVIGYQGASSHWTDLTLIMDVLIELNKKYEFQFNIYGLTGAALDADMYTFKKLRDGNYQPAQNDYFNAALNFYTKLEHLSGGHLPFMPPELHPERMAQANFDIGVAPLGDTEFNHSKSCLKYYEYAAVGTVALCSDVLPYKLEANYRAKNNFKDWYNKLERLITDIPFREKIGKEQQEWVRKNRSLEAISLPWELSCQLPGGLKVKNQQ